MSEYYTSPIADHPLHIEASHRSENEPPRTIVISTPYLCYGVENYEKLIRAFLDPFKGGVDIPANALVAYCKVRDEDGEVYVTNWAIIIVADIDGASATDVNHAVVRCRAQMLNIIPPSFFAMIQPRFSEAADRALSMLSNMVGIFYPHSLEEFVEFYLLRGNLMGERDLVYITNVERFWYEHYADIDPQRELFKVCEIPTPEQVAEAAERCRKHLRSDE